MPTDIHVSWSNVHITGDLWWESIGDRWISLTKWPVKWNFVIFFVAILNKLINKQLRCRRHDTPWRSCEFDVVVMIQSLIDLIHESHNAPDPCPTMHHFVTEIFTCVHISVTKWCIVGCLSNALRDLWDGPFHCVADTGAVLASLCGDQSCGNVTSTSERLYIEFRSTRHGDTRGFFARTFTVDLGKNKLNNFL